MKSEYGAELIDAYKGIPSRQENSFPGSGGNDNTTFAGPGFWEQQSEDKGYAVGHFPAGRLPTGAETQQFAISDSDAFNNLRGIAKTKYPFQPYPVGDNQGQAPVSLRDEFQQSDMAGVSAVTPGKWTYNNEKGSLSKGILKEFDAGTSTFNSLNDGATPYAFYEWDKFNRFGETADYASAQDGINPKNIVDQYKDSYAMPAHQDVPLTPFHKTYPNFGDGHVDYGFNEPGTDTQSEDIIRAYYAVLPEGQLAGSKKDLMPTFSGINQEAVEPRPIMQSLAKQKNTLYLGGLTELPDDLKIDPRQALLAGENIPADLVQTAGELASALDALKYHPGADPSGNKNPYGPRLPMSKLLEEPRLHEPAGFYDYLNTRATEPLDYVSNPFMPDHRQLLQ